MRDSTVVGTTGVGRIHLSTGELFSILDPDPSMIRPEMLAHSLSHICRWTGHTVSFFSVAQHCVQVSRLVPPELALTGLLHDASEAFIGDVSRPLKDIMEELAPGVLRDIEDNLHRAIAARFGTLFPHPPEIKIADNVALATEKRDILDITEEWYGLPQPEEERILPYGPTSARRAWMARFNELTG